MFDAQLNTLSATKVTRGPRSRGQGHEKVKVTRGRGGYKVYGEQHPDVSLRKVAVGEGVGGGVGREDGEVRWWVKGGGGCRVVMVVERGMDAGEAADESGTGVWRLAGWVARQGHGWLWVLSSGSGRRRLRRSLP